MFDVGWQELLLIGVVALVVVGPKDMPKALRTGARLLSKARAMSREFQSGLAEMAREAELEEIRGKVERAARFDLGEELRRSADPHGKLSADFDPTEFNRKLKESVEAGPTGGPATPSVSPTPGGAAESGPAGPAPAPSASLPPLPGEEGRGPPEGGGREQTPTPPAAGAGPSLA